ncbi:MAG: 2-oxo acid dehydrogenase subunit E2 [Planctomycetales bacterium]|nr:2-oxo acid dehydrogenase subunit E2 [Planctomycetales bacterium]
MAIDFKLPNLGENIDSGDVVNVLVKEGDTIAANTALIEVETGKATVEIPCPHAGKITKLLAAAGKTLKVGETIAIIEGSAAGAPAAAKPAAAPPKAEAPKAEAPKAATPKQAEAPKAASAPQAAAPAKPPEPAKPAAPPEPAVSESEESGEPAAPAGPATRRLARELGVDLRRVTGSGPGGRITRDDVVAAVRKSTTSPAPKQAAGGKPAKGGEGTPSTDKFGPVRIQPMTRVRKTIVGSMTRSLTIPQLTNFDDADITELERMRKGSIAGAGAGDVKLTMLPFVMKAVAMALRQHPALNASLDLEKEEIIYKDYVHLGCAVDTERGLVVPVIRDVDQMSIPGISMAVADIADRAKNNQLGLADYTGASFTISNLGAIGGTYSTPIINLPEVAILLLGRSRYLPVVINEKIEVRLMMPLSLSYDHRLIDGATAARFLNEVKNYLQVPGRLLLAS